MQLFGASGHVYPAPRRLPISPRRAMGYSLGMPNGGSLNRVHHSVSWLALSALFLLPACGSSVVSSGVGVGRVGASLSAHAQGVPQSVEVCVLKDALASPSTGTEKPITETCKAEHESDLLWQRALVVLSAYGARLEALSSGTDPENCGSVEAAETGVSGPSFSNASGEGEQAARDAIVQLVTQLGTRDEKADLAKVVHDAATPVKTLCDGLSSYLGAQATALADMRREVEKKRTSRTNRRCGSFENHTVCVGDSVVDRLSYADIYGQLSSLEYQHLAAKDATARFCAAHVALEHAAAAGELGKDKSYTDVTAAIRGVPVSSPSWDATTDASSDEKSTSSKASPSKK